MSAFRGVPLLLSLSIGLLCAVLTWGYQFSRARRATISGMAHRDDLLLGLLVVAAFAGGVFLTYTLFDYGF